MYLDDMRHFLALAQHGRLVAAARHLHVEHTTVSRRVQALERSLGVRLFERVPTGWELTEAGRRLLPHAQSIEKAALAAHNELVGRDAAVSGLVRLVATDAFGSAVVTPSLAKLRLRHPDLLVELVTTSQLLTYRAGEFDIALTLHQPSLPQFRTRGLADYSLRLYAAERFLDEQGPILNVSQLSAHPMVWYVDSLLNLPELHVLHDLVSSPRFGFRSSNVFAQLEAVRSGMGVGLLPCFLAEREPGLVPVLHHTVDVRRTFWLVVASRMLTSNQVQVVIDHLVEELAALDDVLIPPIPQPAAELD